MPTVGNLVASMFVEELRLYSQIPVEISLKTSDGAATSTFGEANNVVYFTREQFLTGLRLPIPSLVKQFHHFSRAPSTLIHSNVFQILMSCSVLNSVYQLDNSLVEMCFIYTLKLRTGGHLSMSARSPQLQFVTGLFNSPKTEAKEVFLVKGRWYGTPGFPGNPFNLNQSLTFLGLSLFFFWHISYFPRSWVY